MTTTSAPQPLKVRTGEIPGEGRLTVPYTLDFTDVNQITVDMTQIQAMQKRISMVQAVFIDNTNNDDPLFILVQNIQQSLMVPAQGQAYLPILVSENIKLSITTTGGVVVQAQFLNFFVPPCVWSINPAPSSTGGALAVTDAILDGTVVGGAVQTTVAGNKTYTSSSGTITAGGTAQVAAAANPGRTGYRIMNISAGALWYNDIGGTASVGGTDCIELAAGSYYESQPGMCSPGQISIIGATTGQAFTLLTC